MKNFAGEDGREWVATADQEDVPRHHGRWYMVLRPADEAGPRLVLPEVRWQTRHTAERSIQSMSEFELRRRLRMSGHRLDSPATIRDSFGAWQGSGPGSRGGAKAG
jgi:hypothetical protein